MTFYKLCNLDLGENPIARKFTVGPYEIELVKEYDIIRTKLSSQIIEKEEGGKIEKENISFDKVEEIPAQVGNSLVTAIATCSNEQDAKLSNAQTNGVWDLCLVFSYLLGRRVYIEEDERRFRHIHHGFNIVQDHQVIQAAKVAWDNIKNFTSEREMLPLWYYLHMNDTPEAELKMLLGCVTLEIIQNIETEEKEIDVPDELKSLIERIVEEIDNSEVDKDLKSSLKSSVTKWGESGSAEKFRQFLVEYGIINKTISGIPKKRVNGINRYRNGIAHSGIIRKPDWIKDDIIKTNVAFFYAGQFIPSLIQEYLDRKFELKIFYWPQQTTQFLKEYIENGIWDGQDIEKNS